MEGERRIFDAIRDIDKSRNKAREGITDIMSDIKAKDKSSVFDFLKIEALKRHIICCDGQIKELQESYKGGEE